MTFLHAAHGLGLVQGEQAAVWGGARSAGRRTL